MREDGVSLRVGAAQRERDDLRTRMFDRRFYQIERILARAQDEAGVEGFPTENQGIFNAHSLPFV